MTQIRNEAELRGILGHPLQRALDKERDRLAPQHVAWLRASPFCVLSTSAADGTCDASPKGDPAGSLVHVIDENRIALAERPGNRRADGWANILSNPHVSLLFIVPGRGDTLRIAGRARLLRTDDGGPDYVDALVVRGKRPVMVCEVEVDQVFFHCAKAFLRSQLWEPESWHPEALPSRAVIAHEMERPEDSVEELEAYYGDQYAKNLY
ncbi:MSMEG_1061 family FMN-dependent PPOX-type flavoprotein [Aeromicrobium sp.]|uniref:MSMEG_1061 family FMN-dependent PPOX-type flavoprotein n=1 Tax=Aeromicrobium sp. TaxID=1871063 RepID=UPI0028AAE443|nr:MSMEG_1061 family FMN-dependent PPOX-type flavoprotein [Aeromicrobium sp.]